MPVAAILFTIWIISPIVLIPAAIYFMSQNKKLERFFEQLRQLGRISPQEYTDKTAYPNYQNTNYQGQNPAPQNGMPQNSMPQNGIPQSGIPHNVMPQNGMPHNVMPQAEIPRNPVYPNPAYQNRQDKNMNIPAPQQTVYARPANVNVKPTNSVNARPAPYPYQNPQFVYSQPTAPAARPQKQRKPASASALLIIGSLLVTLAGMVFAFGMWLSLEAAGRTVLTAVTAAVFFVLSYAARKKFKLDNASMAMYMLGAVFSSIATVIAGNAIIEDSRIFSGNHTLIFAISAAVMTGICRFGVKLFNKRGFAHASLYGGMVSLTLLALQTFLDRTAWALSLNIISAVLLAALYKNIKLSEMYDRPFKLFAAIIAAFYGIVGAGRLCMEFTQGWGIAAWLLALLIFAQLLTYGILLKNKLLLGAQSAMSIIMAVQLGIFTLDIKNRMYALTAVCAVIFAAGIAHLLIKRIRTLFSDYAFAAVLLISLPILSDLGVTRHYTPLCVSLCAAMLLILSAAEVLTSAENLTSANGSQSPVSGMTVLRCSLPIISLICAYNFTYAASELIFANNADYYSIYNDLSPHIFLTISFIFALAMLFVKRLRSAFSDIIMPLVMTLVTLITVITYTVEYEIYERLLSLAACIMLAVVYMLTARDEKTRKHCMLLRCALPLPALLTSFFIGVSCFEQRNTPVFAMQMSVAAFAALFFYGKRLSARVPFLGSLRSAFSDIVMPTAAAVMVLFYHSDYYLDGKYIFLMLIGAAAVTALTVSFCFEKNSAPHMSLLKYILALIICVDLASSVSVTASSSGSRFISQSSVFDGMLVLAAAALIFNYLPAARARLRTAFSDLLFPAVIFCYGCDAAGGTNREMNIQALAIFCLCAAVVIINSFSDQSNIHMTLLRAVSSLPIIFAAVPVRELFPADSYKDDLIIALILTAAAVFIAYLTDKKEYERLVPMRYSFNAAAALSALVIAGVSYVSYDSKTGLIIISLLISCLTYVISARSKNTITGIISVIGVYVCAVWLAASLTFGNERPLVLISAAALLLIAASRLFSSNTLVDRQNGCFKPDIAGFGACLAPFICQGYYTKSVNFITLLIAAAAVVNLCRPSLKADTRRVLITIAAAILCLSFYARPFLLTDNELLKEKTDLLPIVAFGVLVKLIWRGKENIAKNFSFAVWLGAFIMLLSDAVHISSLGNTIFVLCAVLAIMLISYAAKSLRWFAVSAASLAGLTLYITKDFLGRAAWWVYLLAAGGLLIFIAVGSEYFKTHSQKLKFLKDRFFEDKNKK